MADRKQKKVRRRRSGFMDVVNALLTLLVIGVLVGAGTFLYGAHSFYADGPLKADTVFNVEKGANLSSVGDKLESQGLIDSKLIFYLGGIASKKQGQLKAGEFNLTSKASMAKILAELTEGKPIQYGITIPEGLTISQVVDKLNGDDQLTGTLTYIPGEGGILPQTYNFEPGVSRQSVMDEMVAAQKKAVAEVWAQHDPSLPIATPDQLVTLASMVEKETGRADERGKVAAVFVNRLKRHMRLQSDPTTIYGITKGEAPLGRPLKRAEVEQVTAYNTYQIDGLPPGPIANPGMASLKAAANPDNTNDIYFVAASTNPADGHLFAATYAQHSRNVAKLRTAEKLAANSAESDADAEKDALEASAAAAAGDPTAGAQAATDQTATPDQSAAPAQPTDTTPTTDQTAPAPTPVAPTPDNSAPTDQTGSAQSGDSTAPIPMPPRQDDTTTTTTPAPAATTPAPTTPPKPPTRPRPRPAVPDAFGG